MIAVPLLLLVSLVLLAHARAFVSDEIPNAFRPGTLSPLLYAQYLSHFAFHSEVVQKTLANPFSPSRVTIVGVEYGRDVAHFARSGYDVIAVEPLPHYVEHIRSLLADHPDWNVTLHPVAAGNPSTDDTNTSIRYGSHAAEKSVPLRRLDRLVPHDQREMAVLSVDIQGDELDVLQGAEKMLAKGGVYTLWIEAIACNEKLATLLSLLYKHDYAVMDFVPWGRPLSQQNNDTKPPKSIDSFVLSNDRPSKADEYLDWLCAARKKGFHWLQTDLLAVKISMVEDVLSTLLNLNDVCEFPDSNCVLRQLQGLSKPPPTQAPSVEPTHHNDEHEEEHEYEYEYDSEKEDL